MAKRRRGRHEATVELTPLIDVVFILLVFFMIVTNFATYRLIRVETPRETEVVKTSEGAIVIAVAADGTLTFDSESVSPDALSQRIAAVVVIDPGRVFLIRPLEDVSLQEASNIYDTARQAGATSVSFSPSEDAGGAP